MELSTVIKNHINASLATTYTTLPAQIISIKVSDQGRTLVSVQTGVNYVRSDGRAYVDGIIDDVPLVWPSSGGCYITTPLAEGDSVLVHFAMRNSSEWKREGGRNLNVPFTPFMVRHHDINDAFAVPASLFFNDALEVDQSAMRLSSGETEIRILKNGTIEFGAGATEKLIKGNLFKAFLDPILLALKTHTHPDPITGYTGVSSELSEMQVAIPENNLSTVAKTK